MWLLMSNGNVLGITGYIHLIRLVDRSDSQRMGIATKNGKSLKESLTVHSYIPTSFLCMAFLLLWSRKLLLKATCIFYCPREKYND